MRVRSRLAELNEIFTSRNKQLYIVALAITRDRSSAEDCVHEALVAVAEVCEKLDDLEPYLFRVVRNKAVHRVKQNAKYDNSDQFQDYLLARSDSHETSILLDQVKRHISFLDANYRQVLIMKLFSDLTFDEIAKVTENPPNTIASWYRRGLAQLKDRIHEAREHSLLSRSRHPIRGHRPDKAHSKLCR